MSGHGLIEIDHLLTSVASLERAADTFTRMGFTLTPPSVIESMGLANRLVLMTPRLPGTANFVELMTVHDRARLHAGMGALLAGEEGTRSMVLATLDADLTAAALARDGFPVAAPQRLARAWHLPDGEVLDVAFDVLLPVEAPVRFNACRYRTLQHYLRPAWREHANGAIRMARVLCSAPALEDAAGYYARLFGQQPQRSAGCATFRPGTVNLDLYDPAALAGRLDTGTLSTAPGVAGYLIAVASLDAVKACLDRGRIPWHGRGSEVRIEPGVAHGNWIVFAEERAA